MAAVSKKLHKTENGYTKYFRRVAGTTSGVCTYTDWWYPEGDLKGRAVDEFSATAAYVVEIDDAGNFVSTKIFRKSGSDFIDTGAAEWEEFSEAYNDLEENNNDVATNEKIASIIWGEQRYWPTEWKNIVQDVVNEIQQSESVTKSVYV